MFLYIAYKSDLLVTQQSVISLAMMSGRTMSLFVISLISCIGPKVMKKHALMAETSILELDMNTPGVKCECKTH